MSHEQQKISELNKWIWRNVFHGTVIGMTVDGVTGYKLKDDSGEFPNCGGWMGSKQEALFYTPNYTQPAECFELEGKIVEKFDVVSTGKKRSGGYWAETVTTTGNIISATAPTLPLAVMLLARKIEWK